MRKLFFEERTLRQIILYFIFSQPILDVLSYLSVVKNSTSFSLYFKPLVIFILLVYVVLFTKWKRKLILIIHLGLFVIYIVAHLYFFNNIVKFPILNSINEAKYLINILYGVSSFYVFWYFIETDESKKFKIDLINVLVNTLEFFSLLIIISIIFKFSTLSYEHADPYKLGFKGMFNNSSILGHMFVLLYPFVIYKVFYIADKLTFSKIIYLIMPLVVMFFIGNKVPYFSVVLICILAILFERYQSFFTKKRKIKLTVFSLLIIAIFGSLYPISYNRSNSIINQNVSTALIGSVAQIVTISSSKIDKIEADQVVTEMDRFNYAYWEVKYKLDEFAKKYPFIDGGNTRAYQILYSLYTIIELDIRYKVLGIGFDYQPQGLQPESDFIMAALNFGILGFVLMLGFYILIYLRFIFEMFKKIKQISALNFLLFVSASAFFGVSIYAGYTFLYTNFNLYLAAVFALILAQFEVNHE